MKEYLEFKITSTNINSYYEYFLLFPFTIKDSLSTTPQDIFHLFLLFHSFAWAEKEKNIVMNNSKNNLFIIKLTKILKFLKIHLYK